LESRPNLNFLVKLSWLLFKAHLTPRGNIRAQVVAHKGVESHVNPEMTRVDQGLILVDNRCVPTNKRYMWIVNAG